MGRAKTMQRTYPYMPASVAIKAFRKSGVSELLPALPETTPPTSLSCLCASTAELPPHIIHAAFNGTYYSDVNARYAQNAVPLWCDLCGKDPLRTCIGAKGVDLCLECAENIHYRANK